MLHNTRFVIVLFAFALAPQLNAQQSAPQADTTNISHGHASADPVWDELVAGNQRFVNGNSRRPDYAAQRQKLTNDQHPSAAVLSCSDSRLPPEIVFDQGLGDLFVVRAAGNSADPLGLGSLE